MFLLFDALDTIKSIKKGLAYLNYASPLINYFTFSFLSLFYILIVIPERTDVKQIINMNFYNIVYY